MNPIREKKLSLICIGDSLLVLAEHSEFLSRERLLDWYAANYAFDRKRLSARMWLDVVKCEVEP